jgi:hypothetical protein
MEKVLKPDKSVRNFVLYPRVEAGSNTSTVTLRVAGDDEKETQCLGV